MIVAHASWLVSPRPNGRVLLGKTRKCPGHYVEAQNRIAWHATDSLLNPYVSEWTVNYPYLIPQPQVDAPEASDRPRPTQWHTGMRSVSRSLHESKPSRWLIAEHHTSHVACEDIASGTQLA